jgi:hypothetical protein
MFQSLYTLKALSRFPVAVLGCSVEGTSSNTVDEIRVGDVKAIFFPAGEAVDMKVAPTAAGSFSLGSMSSRLAAPVPIISVLSMWNLAIR